MQTGQRWFRSSDAQANGSNTRFSWCKSNILEKEEEAKVKFAKYDAHGKVAYGIVEGDLLKRITTTPFEPYEITDYCDRLRDVKLLAPSTPSKILAMSGNYISHLKVKDRQPSKEPQIFFKTPNSIVGPDDTIILPKNSGKVEEEHELVVVVSRRCSKVSKTEALAYVLGYTNGFDVSARGWQYQDKQWWRAKSSDTFGPIGPYIATDVDASNLEMQASINGVVVQRCNTSELLFDIPTIISFVSQVVTLLPGDLIFTGTSGKAEELHDGDVVEGGAEGIGALRNFVKAE